ncbi:PP0621 family protein [Roseateles violae]|uniref:PP0621 family protein n=1 Tax=Roseateles violae TaxID=3058042 RepID=A0ABT8DX15_9BURK|nr:PP0621 family protein [Pelomonas sp. PFR6]MDN3921059.1 PP0621 family protein [Pelomonas sp. PFR6]
MKYLLLILLLALLVFLLGVKRARPPRRAKPPAAPRGPQPMLSCARCGLHLPRDEALPGRGGVFCSAAHRAAYEAEHGGAP